MSATSPRPAPRLTRRQGLAAVGLIGPMALLVACSSDEESAPAATLSTEPEAVSPDVTVAAEEALLIAHYDAVLEGLPEAESSTREALVALREQHVAHREALGGGGEPLLDDLPETPSIASLASAEKAASKARIASCVDAADPELARTLAFIAASEASHVPALKELA